MNFDSDDVIMRKVIYRDVPYLYHNIYNKSTITKPAGFRPYVCYLQMLLRYITMLLEKKSCLRYVIVYKGEPVGTTTVYFNKINTLSCMLSDKVQNMGLGTYCVKRIIKDYFSITDSPIYAIIQITNTASIHLVNKCGFKCNGYFDKKRFLFVLHA